jgi:fumarylacetoacetate (FAA) hydrolase
MKLATYKDGSRDGQLVVVSRDLSQAHYATGIANTLQQALDDWNFIAPQLQDLSVRLQQGKTHHAFAFDAAMCMAPLPRAYQWADGSAYLNHLELVGKANAKDMPAEYLTRPLVYQGGSDDLQGARDPIRVTDTAWGVDFEAELAVITGDVDMGCTPEQALESVRLITLVNDVSLRRLVPAELASGFGFFQGKPATAMGPVAVTPDELGDAWMDGRVHLTMQTSWNGRKVGRCEAGPEMGFHFGEIIAHMCRTRRARAGTIVGSGTISNKDWSHGYSCIAEKRMIEKITDGKSTTDFMQFGDTVHLEMKGRDGLSVFGAIEQEVEQWPAPSV